MTTPSSSSTSSKLVAGSPAFWRSARGMFAGGFGTFAMLYCLQPLMPQFSQAFGVSAAQASGVVSASTASLALGLLPASWLADRVGRKPLMVAALSLSALLTLGCALASSFGQLLVLRALVGLALAGLPATAMAYLAEEMEPASLGRVMGLYVGGNALGGMGGRLLAALVVERYSWRVALVLIGVLGVLTALVFWRNLAPSRHFRPLRGSLGGMWRDARAHAGDAGLPWLFFTSFALMGCFVSVYNYLGYRLAAPPYSLSPGTIGLVFALYMVGSLASAWGGRLSDRLGRRNVLWLTQCIVLTGLGLTLAVPLVAIVAGLTLCTVGFFAGHSVASSWVGLRARQGRALASALYLACYYLGGSIVGSASGVAFGMYGWHGVIGLLALVQLAALAAALRLRQVQPLPRPPS
ncbi:MFS transporter [Paludibacterium purpuratum]|uniref:YNFM family putative membrane transporter n=1 Tax=Paludibacterium purpuratum TaxID=1144873 RepID=A0A4R7B6F7_9NEIS|nr:MFS transporter [Paludibacterium purpuratum]TDR80228.1 YNFM family putative membrane transporter [Paludibacterium purpuratum]